MAAALVHSIDILRIAKMGPAYGVGQRIVFTRYRDKMNVIRHKTIRSCLKGIFVALLFEKLQIYTPVIINKEDVLLVVAPLRYVVRIIRCYYSG